VSRPEWMSHGSPGPLQRLVSDQRILFLIVGGGNTLFSTLLYAGMVLLMGPRVPAVASLLAAWLISVLLVFFVYRKLVFRVRGNGGRDFASFCSVNVASLAINAGLLVLLADVMGLPPIPTQVGITGVVVLFNYFGHKYFSFRR